MEQRKNFTGLKAAILTMSFIQMATNAVSSILADIAAQFPETSVTAIQYLMTFPNLLVVVVSVFSAKLSEKFAKRNLAATGLIFAGLAGGGSFVFHGSLAVLYLWAGMLGVGIGLTVPVANSLISDYFTGEEKDTLLGYQTSAANVGSMMMTFFGGMLATIAWYYDYLVYFLAIPGLILTLLFVPGQNVKTAQKTVSGKQNKIPGFAIGYLFIAAVFMMLFYIGPTNLAMFAAERGIGESTTVGMAATILLFGGVVMGLLFGKLSAKIGVYTIPLGFVVLFIAYLLLYRAQSVGIFYIGSFLVGITNTMVLPQCMGQVVTENKEQSTFLMSLVLAVANLGTFLAPALTTLSAAVTGNDLAESRFLMTGLIALAVAVISALIVRRKR